jgi:hypothetical protein
MKLRIALIIALFAGVAAFALNGRVSAQASNGRLRFLHAVPGAPAVDVFVNNTLAARNLAFANATRYLTVPKGDHKVIVQATGTGAAPTGTSLLSADVSVTEDKLAQLIVVGGTTTAPEALVYAQELGPVAVGKTRITAVNAVKDAPPIDIARTETGAAEFILGLKYGQTYGEIDLEVNNFEFVIIPAGGEITSAIIKPFTVGLDAGTHNTMVVVGTLEGAVKPTFLLLTAPTQADAADNALVRFVNVTQADTNLDVYVNGALVSSLLGFRDATERVALPVGDGKIEVRKSGDLPTATALATGTLEAGAQTVVFSGTADKLTFNSFEDDVATLDATKARLSVINLLDAPADLTVGGKALVSKVTATTDTRTAELDRGVYKYELSVADLKVNVTGSLTINGGTASNLIIAGTPDAPAIVLATSSLSETLGSVPVNTTADDGTTPIAVAPTPTLAGNTNPTNPTNPTSEPVPTLVAAQATDIPTTDPNVEPETTATPTPRPAVQPGATGVVITNEGVNLKIREYPRTDAKTLGLIPSGSTVRILGIRGPASSKITPTNSGDKTKIPTTTAVATDRADLWVFIEWEASDGGLISGWTIAQYLDITINGRLTRRDNITDLLALPQIPEDEFGVIESSAATPIAPDDKRTIGTVTTLVGTNAQLRRTPSVSGESLALVPSGGIVFILGKTEVPVTGEVGQPKSPVWFNVQFDVEGSSIIGWMSADFLVLTTRYNGKPVDVKDVPVITDIQPGSIRGNATQVQPGAGPGITAVVTNILAGANLQLRRLPDTNAESLALIPSGSEVEVLGRNGAGTWLEIKFNNITGWANANFLNVTRNGRIYPIKDLKVTNGDIDTFGTTTPTVTPTATPVGAG